MIRKFKYKLLKRFVRTFGMSSNGIRLSFEEGLTSGNMLDYAYRNQPSGRFLIGRWIDKIYLSHRNWQAVRVRKENLERLLDAAIRDLSGRGKPVKILDMGSGPSLYMLETLQKSRDRNISVICQDLDDEGLREGRQHAEDLGLKNIVYEQGNALDEKYFKGLPWKPNLVVASGFYDWILDDLHVLKSIEIVSDYLEKGGELILTNLSGDVDLDMITEVFVDFDKRPQRLTARSEATIGKWLQSNGFKVHEILTDSWGRYIVIRAKK